MRVLAAARHPGPAEAVAPVASELRRAGHDVLLMGVRNDTPETKTHGGSANIFRRQDLSFVEQFEDGYEGDVVGVPPAYADSLIDSFEPERIVVGCSTDLTGVQIGIEDALVAAGERHGIPTVQIVESFDSWSPRREPSLASTYAAMEEYTRRILETRGVPTERIVVTGHPGLDGYATATVDPGRPGRAELGVHDERLLVYFGQAEVSDGAPDDPTTLRWVVDALQPTDRLIFTPHPRDIRDYSDILERAAGQLVHTGRTSDELLSVADVALTHYSTMGLKSALLNIPTVNLLLEGDWREIRDVCGGFPLSLMGGSYEVGSEGELKTTLGGELTGRALQAKAGLRVDGVATRRVAELVVG